MIVKFITMKGVSGIAASPYYVGFVQHDRTMSRRETYEYCAERTGFKAAAVELGKVMKPDESKLRADYDLTLREIVLRLKKEVCDGAADNGSSDRGGAIDKEVAPSPLERGVAGSDNGANGQAGDKVVVVEHDGHSIPQRAG